MGDRIRWNYELVKDFIESKGYKLLSNEYKKTRDKLTLICPQNHVFEITFVAFKNNPKCKICEGREYNHGFVKSFLKSEGYKLISKKYINSHTNIEMQCHCGHIFKMNFANFKFGQRCPRCAGVEKFTYEEVKRHVESLDYKLLSEEYINSQSKLLVGCNKGHIFEISYHNFKQGGRCPKCLGKNWEYEEVKNYIENLEYELLSQEYRVASDKLKLKCKEGHIFEMTFSKFKQGQGCKICANKRNGEKLKFSYMYVKEYIENHGYKLLSDTYSSSKEKLMLQCPKGHMFEMTFENFKMGCRCTVCFNLSRGNTLRHSYEYVKEYVENVGYRLLSKDYKNDTYKITLMCDVGHIFKISFAKFKHGRRCPICSNKSNGEIRIKEFLEKYKLNYTQQYKFDDCKFKNTLPFDFYLIDYNTLIEYDGIQHFEIIDFFGGFDGFVSTKIRDTVKNIYCRDNNIPLIRIPYWEFDDIEDILISKINKLNLRQVNTEVS